MHLIMHLFISKLFLNLVHEENNKSEMDEGHRTLYLEQGYT